MSAIADIKDHGLSVAGILRETVRTVCTAPLWFLAAGLFAFIPSAYLIAHHFFPVVPYFDKTDLVRGSQVVSATKFLFDLFTYAVMIRGAYGIVTDCPVSVQHAMGIALKRSPIVLLATVLTTIIIALGFNFFVVPGFIALLAFFVTVPVCLIEKAGPLKSIGRSILLTRNARFRILGAWVVVLIPTVLAFAFTIFILPIWVPWYGNTGIGYVVFSAVIGFNASFVAIVYRDLAEPRQRETVTRVFS